jgi:GNAT superfamily N-acetyltransferase
MDLADYVLVRLDPDDESAATFDCGDVDLNNFLLNDAAKYQKERLSVTHLLTLPADDTVLIVGYFCLLTDKLVFNPAAGDEQRKVWKKFNREHKIHFNKQRRVYPAVKIGRLAVAGAFAGKGVGSRIIEQIITMIIDMDNVGCRFITVDAYRNVFGFYPNNHFNFLSDDDNDEKTRVMYLDIKRFYP